MTTFIPHTDPELHGCYQDTGETTFLSEWLNSRGFRVIHTATHHAGGHTVHAEYPITAGVTLNMFIAQALDSGGVPFCASFQNEDGVSFTVYPEPYAGSLIRPNGQPAAAYLAQKSEVQR